jgi:hypothetical protein
MHIFSRLIALAAAVSLCGKAMSAPINRFVPVSPGTVKDIIITAENTINATAPPPEAGTGRLNTLAATPSNARLPLALVNNFPGGNINAYVTGLDSQGRLVMLTPQGTFFYPSGTPGQPIPQAINANVAIPLGPKGSTTPITIPDYISSARIWFAAGNLHFYTTWQAGASGPSLTCPSSNNPKDPSASTNWGFVELTNNEDGGLYANLSYVDFVGLVLGMSMTAEDGSTQTALGLHANAIPAICQKLATQTTKDGQPWADLCQTATPGSPLRVVAPIDYISTQPAAFESYFNSYIDQVWSHYTTNTLTIATQSPAGNVACRVANNALSCAGDNRPYARPSAADIFGCNSGPFAIEASDNGVHRAVVPRLCAAFNRGTLMINGGGLQPGVHAQEYYGGQAPANWYSAFVHQNQVDGRGYAFSYDDVSPDGGVDQSGTVAGRNPRELRVVVGGPM